jgi:hypothetical protein
MDLKALLLNCTIKKSPAVGQYPLYGKIGARMIKAAGGIPAEGNPVPGWQPAECETREQRMPVGHVG